MIESDKKMLADDKYIVFKLTTGEELVAHQIEDTDYEVRVLFPMLVKHVPRMSPAGMMESIVLSPFTYFSASDEYTFTKNNIIFIKDLDPRYETEYERSVDDFVGNVGDVPEPHNPEELQQLHDKLASMFREHVSEEDDIEALPSIHVDTSKLIH
jgi:hypothetical protein